MDNKIIDRYEPDLKIGLTEKQIDERIKNNLINYDTSVPTKSIPQILKENFFTLFNLINLVLAVAIFTVGSYKNMLFLFIIIINTAISTFQELHSKKIVDKLSVLASSKARVLRDSKEIEISINEIVLDDILIFNTGNQIPTDSIILNGDVEVDESFLTGEPDAISKKIGDTILSGSFIVSGKCKAKVIHIAEDNYTSKISSGAKYVKKLNSEIMISLNKIIKILTFAIIPVGILLFLSQIYLSSATYKDAVIATVAGIIGMIPEGLVLLTSTVLAISVIRLSKSKVLVQELYCIETLARVDTLCLDKTGTLTEGKMEVKDFVPINISKNEITNILANIAKFSDDENPTINAIKDYFTDISNLFSPNEKIAFSSKAKWSGINFKENGSYILGAPEFVLGKNFYTYQKEINTYSKDYRVLVLAHSSENFANKNLPNNLSLIGYIFINDKIRKNASKTLKYFKEQNVDIKIISGDNPITVSKIAKEVGLENYNKYIDMSKIETQAELKQAVMQYTIFGRVSPSQKKDLVLALQEHGKTVAMTGDGVNDVLSLKAADCSIAMANGSDATKNVSQLILLDSNFASMPKVVAEGRRTINNIQRSASLFLVKTIYSTVLALMFIFMSEQYPFQPIQLSLISLVTIGIPSFLLALEPNKERIKGNFLKNVISNAIPTALTAIVNIFSLSMLVKFGLLTKDYYSTLCVISTSTAGLLLLFNLSRKRNGENYRFPFSPFRLILSFLLVLLFIICLTKFDWWFNICALQPIYFEIFKLVILTIINFVILNLLSKKILKV